MLTFEHYCDSPIWAAVAGYKFNIIDSISVAAIRSDAFYEAGLTMWKDFPNWEVREVPACLIAAILVTFAAILYPLTYWIFGIALHINCKRHVRKYKHHRSEVVKKNLADWKADCDRRFSHG